MELAKALDVRQGVTAIIGAGGKTTLLLALARELAQAARVIVTTTTHIYPPDGFPCLLRPGEAEIAAALEKHPCICVGKPAKEGKITAADVPVRTLAELADYVLVEADGAHGPACKGPCGTMSRSIPPEANQTILVFRPLGARAAHPGVRPPARDLRGAVRRFGRRSADAGAGRNGLSTTETPSHARPAESGGHGGAPRARARELAAMLRGPVCLGALQKEWITCLILIRGAGDLASGVALRLHRADLPVVMTDLPQPTAIRRTVCFSQAIRFGKTTVEDAVGVCCKDGTDEVKAALSGGGEHTGPGRTRRRPAARGCIRKSWLTGFWQRRNLGTKIDRCAAGDRAGAGLFARGADCHAVIETMRGHTLGQRDPERPEPIPNTNIPGPDRRLCRTSACCARRTTGIFHQLHAILATLVDGRRDRRRGERPADGPARSAGVLRGILRGRHAGDRRA